MADNGEGSSRRTHYKRRRGRFADYDEVARRFQQPEQPGPITYAPVPAYHEQQDRNTGNNRYDLRHITPSPFLANSALLPTLDAPPTLQRQASPAASSSQATSKQAPPFPIDKEIMMRNRYEVEKVLLDVHPVINSRAYHTQVLLVRNLAAYGRLEIMKTSKYKAIIQHEAKLMLTKLRGHPNVVNADRIFEGRQSGFLLMEYCRYGNLQDYLRTEWRMRVDCLGIARQVFAALYFIHSQNIFHKDMHLENILVWDKAHDYPDGSRPAPVVKIADFGMSVDITEESKHWQSNP